MALVFAPQLGDLLAAHRPAWMSDALCREHPELNWFPERGESWREQQAVCRRCPVRAECLEYALDGNAQGVGVWGGRARGGRGNRTRLSPRPSRAVAVAKDGREDRGVDVEPEPDEELLTVEERAQLDHVWDRVGAQLGVEDALRSGRISPLDDDARVLDDETAALLADGNYAEATRRMLGDECG